MARNWFWQGAALLENHGDNSTRVMTAATLPSKEDELLIAAAPDLLAACEAQHKAIDLLFAMLIKRDSEFFPSKSGAPWDAAGLGHAAILKATGGQ